MANIKSLKRQHKKIEEIMRSIEKDIENNQVETKISNIIKNISYLSGVLTIHLRQEDEIIYPNLMNSEEQDVKEIVNCYLEEMKEISASFNQYKNRFNTSRKILSQMDTFIDETCKLICILRARIDKENIELYDFLSRLDDREFIKMTVSKKEN